MLNLFTETVTLDCKRRNAGFDREGSKKVEVNFSSSTTKNDEKLPMNFAFPMCSSTEVVLFDLKTCIRSSKERRTISLC